MSVEPAAAPVATIIDGQSLAEFFLSEPGPAGLFTRLTRVGLLLDAFQHRCLDAFGLRFIDFSLLRVLLLAGPSHRLSPTELSELLLRSTGGITQITDRLVRAGLVERTPDPVDRRKVLVGLTPEGRRRIEEASAVYTSERDRILSELSPQELRRLDVAVHRMLEVLGAEAEAW